MKRWWILGVSGFALPLSAATMRTQETAALWAMEYALPAGALCLAAGIAVYYWLQYRRKVQKINALETVIAHLPVHFFVCDSNGNLLAAHPGQDNGAAAPVRKVQYLPEVEPDLEEMAAQIRAVLETGISRSSVSNARRRTFRKLPATVFGREAVLVVTVDCTEQQNQEQIIQTMLQRQTLGTDQLTEGVIVIDAAGNVKSLNAAAANLTGFSVRHAVGLPCNQVFVLAGPRENVLEPAWRNNRRVELPAQAVLLSCDGRRYEVTGHVAPFPGGNDRADGAVLVFSDQTQRLAEQKDAKIRDAVLANALQLADLGYFRYNPKSRVTTCSSGFEHLWPFRDGVPLPEAEWVYQDDIDEFLTRRNRLIAGEDPIFTVNYRSDYFGDLRYYRLRGFLDDENGEKVIFGVVQNITSINEKERKFAAETEFVRVLFDILPCPFFIKEISNQYRYVMSSRNWYQLMNKTPEEVVGKSDFEIFSPEIAKWFRDADLQANGTEAPVHVEDEVVSADGQVQTYHTLKMAYTTKDGRRMLLGMGVDITASRQAVAREKELQIFWKKLLDLLPACVLAKDVDNEFRYVLWNKLLQEHTGYPATQVIGKHDLEFTPFPGLQQSFRDGDLQLLRQGGGTVRFHESLVSATGRSIHYDTTKTLLESNGHRYIVELCLDHTHERELELEREKSLVELNNFVTNAALVNSCLKRITVENDFDRVVNDILQLIGNCKNADRAYIFHYTDAECRMAACQYEWVRDGVAPRQDMPSQIDLGQLPEWQSKLRNQESILIEDVNHPPPELAASMAVLRPRDLKSLCVVGIYANGKAIGFLGIDFVLAAHHFTDSNLRTIRDAVSIFQLAYQRKLQFEALAESTAVQKLIIDMMSTPILLVDKNFNVVHINNSAGEHFDTDITQCIGKPCFDNLCRRNVPDAGCAIYQTLQQKTPHRMEKTIRNRDYIVNTQPIYQNGEIVQILETFTDVTEINQSKKLLEQSARDAREAAQAKSMFLATMSHELRTPLNAVIGFAELLQLGSMTRDEELEAVRSIHFAGSTLLELINDVLDLSKLEAGQMKIVPVKMNLAEMLTEMRKIFEQKLQERNISGTNIFPPNLPELYLDTLRLRQILFNLIGNAIKFTHVGGVQVEVEFVRRNREVGDLTIHIKDTGDGISAEYMKRIFDPFGQQRTHIQQGTGLGLPISKRLVEQMNGTLSVNSIVRKGSCFSLSLPEIRYEEITADTPDRPVTLPVNSVRARVLLVDDVPLNLKVMSAMAAKLDLTVETATSGREALSKVPGFQPELILTDMWMPEMNGEELAAVIRKNPAYNHIKIVVVTADSEISDTGKKYFDRILLKPLTIGKLHDAVLAALHAAGNDPGAPPGNPQISQGPL